MFLVRALLVAVAATVRGGVPRDFEAMAQPLRTRDIGSSSSR
jgi:hypothetical protein